MNVSKTTLATLACSLSLVLSACGGGGGSSAPGAGPAGATSSTSIPDGSTGPTSIPDDGTSPVKPAAIPQMTQLAGTPYRLGNANGPAATARFSGSLGGAVLDDAGNLYVGDASNNVVRRITPAGDVTTFAGMAGMQATNNGTLANARFSSPYAMARDKDSGVIYVMDRGNSSIRVIGTDGMVTKLAGSSYGFADGTGASAKFATPMGMTVGNDGNLYVADTENHVIRRVTPAGVVTTFAGMAGMQGSTNATGTAARFSSPQGITTGPGGELYVSENSHTIRRIAMDGSVTTLAGLYNTSGSTDGIGAAARLYNPRGLAFDAGGKLVVASGYARTIRRIDVMTGAVETLAGSGQRGADDGMGAAATFSVPTAVVAQADGNVIVTDEDGVIRKVAADGKVTTVAGAWSQAIRLDATGMAARFINPAQNVQDEAGNVYVADMYSYSIRRITPEGVVTTLAGGINYGVLDGTGMAARFGSVTGITIDKAGVLYVADAATQTIRKVTTAGVVTTLAGTMNVTGAANGTGANASFYSPRAIVASPDGNLYVADTLNSCVRKITTAGVVTSFAGTCGGVTGTGKADNDDGLGAAAKFIYPTGISADAAGNLYVAENGSSRIRKIKPDATVTTLAGGADNATAGFADGTGIAALFFNPGQIAADADGNVYVADTRNHVIRKVTPAGVVTTVVGKGGISGDTGGLASAADGLIYDPSGVSVGPLGLVVSTGQGLVRVGPAP